MRFTVSLAPASYSGLNKTVCNEWNIYWHMRSKEFFKDRSGLCPSSWDVTSKPLQYPEWEDCLLIHGEPLPDQTWHMMLRKWFTVGPRQLMWRIILHVYWHTLTPVGWPRNFESKTHPEFLCFFLSLDLICILLLSMLSNVMLSIVLSWVLWIVLVNYQAWG